jgi:phosphomethylpyrimidine synthase
MKITQDVREYAAQKQVDDSEALALGMNEKAKEFMTSGGEIYHKVERIEAPPTQFEDD